MVGAPIEGGVFGARKQNGQMEAVPHYMSMQLVPRSLLNDI